MDAAFSGAVAAAISLIGTFWAHRAARNSKPVSNGFADSVRADLAYIRGQLDEHVRNHQ